MGTDKGEGGREGRRGRRRRGHTARGVAAGSRVKVQRVPQGRAGISKILLNYVNISRALFAAF